MQRGYSGSRRYSILMEATTNAEGMAPFVFSPEFPDVPDVKVELKGAAAKGCSAYLAVGPTTKGVTVGVTKPSLVGVLLNPIPAAGVLVSIRAERI